jgi:hypothetical protein
MNGNSSRKIGETMASPWRQRRMCLILAERPAPAAIRHVSARGAFLETNARPALGSTIELRHPDAGTIYGEVAALALDGIDIAFACGPRSVAFALAAIGADMSRPAR